MDSGQLNLAIKMICEEYKLTSSEVVILSRRMIADDREFLRVWSAYKNKTKMYKGGVDKFKELLHELLS